jgi:LuxR family maltose regulon positive regulatory protein
MSKANLMENRPLIVESLTERELEVLRFMSGWLTTSEIADEMFLSINTIKSHMKSIYQKLGTNSKSETMRIAYHLDLI